MSLENFAITLEEFNRAIELFIAQRCKKEDDHLVHRDCGGGIRIGFLNLFYLNNDGSLDPGSDGFGIGPKRVPYCERCFPPDGFNHTYAVRFPILRERPASEGQNYEFIWGHREIESKSKKLLLE